MGSFCCLDIRVCLTPLHRHFFYAFVHPSRRICRPHFSVSPLWPTVITSAPTGPTFLAFRSCLFVLAVRRSPTPVHPLLSPFPVHVPASPTLCSFCALPLSPPSPPSILILHTDSARPSRCVPLLLPPHLVVPRSRFFSSSSQLTCVFLVRRLLSRFSCSTLAVRASCTPLYLPHFSPSFSSCPPLFAP